MDRGQSEYTREKQEVFGTIVATHVRVVRGIKSKHRRGYERYSYADLNAGPGFNSDAGVAGSPIIVAACADAEGVPVDMWLFEADDAKRSALTERMAGREGVSIYGDHRAHWGMVTAWNRPDRIVDGLVYWDPFGDPVPVNIINGLIASPRDKVDVLLHVNANGAYKRPRGRGHADYQGRYLADDIGRINKQFWWVREPATDWQWTFLIGSNWSGFPQFRKLGFHRLDSPRGLAVLDRLNLSKRESDGRWPRLPFDVSPPTARTPSTSSIRDFWLSEPSSCSVPLADASGAASGRQPNRTT